MTRILSAVVTWVIRQAGTLLLILMVLVVAAWIRGELKRDEELRRDRASLVKQRDAIATEIAELKRSAAEHSRQAEAAFWGLGSLVERKRAERQALWDKHPWARNIPLSDAWRDLRLLDLEIAGYQSTLDKITRSRKSAATELNLLALKKQHAREETHRQITGLEQELGKSTVSRYGAAIYQQLPTAGVILVGIILLPLLIKVFLYFVVAPLAAARPPIRILPRASGRIEAAPVEASAGNRGGKVSAVSIPIVLGEREELLIQPHYLQSTSVRARKSTKWLLNASIPFSSLLSGMFLLIRVAPAGSEPVVISATKDPLSEVGVLDLADGAAFVCQPRALAGLIQDCERPIAITRHWRLGTLQGWLTLQLRFLVFHGPGQLVMKGCRGIRMEHAGTGRLINQAATLGFSANLAYANTRCETFVSYWIGKEDLFNDLFTGEGGAYVFEETPSSERTAGAGRHLRGFADAMLKIFGV